MAGACRGYAAAASVARMRWTSAADLVEVEGLGQERRAGARQELALLATQHVAGEEDDPLARAAGNVRVISA